jgi:DNA-binding transcriptional regulator YiaG
MANISVVLRNLIRRVARKEIREDTSTTKKAILQYRRDIASLKRQICVQAKELSFLKAQEDKRLKQPAASAVPSAGRSEGLRFSARSVRAQRKRLGLTRRRFAKLVGVSPLTIFNWEHGQSRPREAQFTALVAVRHQGRREVWKKLELLEAHAEKAVGARPKIARRKPR